MDFFLPLGKLVRFSFLYLFCTAVRSRETRMGARKILKSATHVACTNITVTVYITGEMALYFLWLLCNFIFGLTVCILGSFIYASRIIVSIVVAYIFLDPHFTKKSFYLIAWKERYDYLHYTHHDKYKVVWLDLNTTTRTTIKQTLSS